MGEDNMNTTTGKIVMAGNKTDLINMLQMQNSTEDFVEVDPNSMTNKQKKEMQVSKFDNKSELGKLFTMNRHERRKRAKLNK
jgi:hypothetical protein